MLKTAKIIDRLSRGDLRSGALLGIAALLLSGCVSDRPVVPLVPLPESRMPSREDLQYRPWRVVVAEIWGRHAGLEQAFAAELKNQLGRYGIRTVSSDAKANAVMQQILQTQIRGGGTVSARDIQYEMSHADGIISVHVTAYTVKRSNELYTWKDKEDKVHHRYTSEVYVEGHCTLTPTRTGDTRTLQFSQSETKTSQDRPHQFSAEAMALTAGRKAAHGSRLMEPIYTEFPLVGYVIGPGEEWRQVKINRGSRHGVRRGRMWDFILESTESNVLVGDVTTRKIVGGGKTVAVYPEVCLVKCNSTGSREAAKLGMKAKARGFGFIWPW